MAKRLFVDGNIGSMFIGDSTLPNSAASDPTPYIDKLNFHSGLNYVEVLGTVTAYNVAFSAVNRTVVTWGSGGKC